LDKIQKAVELGIDDIAAKETTILRQHIQELPKNSVVIIEAASALHQIADHNYWTQLNTQKIEFLRHEIKPLFRTVSQVDFKAMRFYKDVLEISLALLDKPTWSNEEKIRFETLKDGLVEQISELPLSVPIVAREQDLIKTSQHKHYWSNCTDTGLDELAAKLASLMRFREAQNPGSGPGQVKLDLTDVLHNKEKVEFGPQHEACQCKTLP
jgi:type I restriction enzyme R subunit